MADAASAAGTDPIVEGVAPPSFAVDPSLRGKSQEKIPWERRRMHPIKRVYGPSNADVRREVHRIETESTQYWRTGVLGDPNHRIEYSDDHPYERMRRERERKRTLGAGDETGSNAAKQPEEAERRAQGDSNEGLTNGEDGDDNESPAEDGDGANSNAKDRSFTMQAEGDGKDGLFKPMRIFFDTDALELQRNALNGAQIDFIENEVLPRMGLFWSNALSVVPVKDRLFISAAELANRQYCGDSEFTRVPADHIANGVPDTDLVLYVSGQPSTRFCGPSTLAVAVACNFDQWDRPTAGAVNFCLEQIELDEDGQATPAMIEDFVDVAVHEAAHVMGMSSNSYRFFWNATTGEPRTNRNFKSTTVTCVDGIQRTLILPDENTMKFFVANNGQRYASIVTEKVAQVARNQFNCQSLMGAQLENQPTGSQSCTGDHWDEKLFYPEALSGVISPTTNVMSPLTLALMEDSGWYHANYSMSRVSPWGHGVGCEFVTDPCIVQGQDPDTGENEAVVPDYGRGFFCAKASERGCSPAHTHKMACTVIDYSLFFPQVLPDPQFQYFLEAPAQGGPRQADYCPVFGSTYAGLRADQLDCREPENADLLNFYSEDFTPNSMCFETSSDEGRCYIAQCIMSDFVLQVNIRGEWHTCERDFQELSVKVGSGAIATTLTCPRLSQACPDMFCPANCAGRGRCVFGQDVNGTTRPRCECFDTSDTSPGCVDSLVTDGKYLEDSSGLLSDLNEGFFDPLVSVFVDHPDQWTTASWAWAAGLFVILLLMILCICSSFWPQKKGSRKGRGRYGRY